jgi:hypothetical protein
MRELHDAEGWYYRGECAANIVVAYGGDDPELTGKVLRLRQASKGEKKVPNATESSAILTIEEQNIWADWPDMLSVRHLLN